MPFCYLFSGQGGGRRGWVVKHKFGQSFVAAHSLCNGANPNIKYPVMYIYINNKIVAEFAMTVI